jgi:hypothetical protein
MGQSMSVYFAIPSCRPAAEAKPVLAKWRAAGYRIALLRQGELLDADITIPTDQYLGWASSINILARFILDHDPGAQWIVSGGDDTLPDPYRTAEEIARECIEHFSPGWESDSTFGVMQPVGDLKLWPGSAIDKFAGSPWMGREFCERMYQGNGPVYDGYHHNWADEELQEVAIKLGVFWQRPDLTHRHNHWMRAGESRPQPPSWSAIAQDYQTYHRLFRTRKAAGFPGHEPLEALS